MFGHEDEIRLLVCGSRDFADRRGLSSPRLRSGVINDLEIMRQQLKGFPRIDWLIHGAAEGADLAAAHLMKFEFGIPEDHILSFPAKWNAYGIGAGPKRNGQMLEEGKPNRVLAFFSDVGASRGTANMVYQALRAGLVVKCVERKSRRIFFATNIVARPDDWTNLVRRREDLIGKF